MRGFSYQRLEAGGLQWPCPNEEHPGTVFLHKDRFAKGLGTFFAIDHKDRRDARPRLSALPHHRSAPVPLPLRHDEPPGRRFGGKAPECLVEMAAADAARYGIAAGDRVKIRTGAAKSPPRRTSPPRP